MSISISKTCCITNGIIVPCTGSYNEEEGLVLGKYSGSKNKSIEITMGTLLIKIDDFSLMDVAF